MGSSESSRTVPDAVVKAGHSRRDVTLALAAVTALASSPPASAQGRDGRVTLDVGASRLREFLSDDEIAMLSHAALAPSGHNTQPWTVDVVGPGHWRIGTDRSRWLPAVDPQNRETTLSIGAFLENLVIAARRHGRSVQYQVTATSTKDAALLDLRLGKAEAQDVPMEPLQRRRTVRNGYANRLLTESELSHVTARSSAFHYFARGTAGARYLSEGTIQANQVQAYREPAQVELADWIRWSAADQAKYRNGLTPAGMEIEGVAGWYVSHFYDRDSALTRSFREKGLAQVRERVAEGAGWLVLEGAPGISGLIETGREFQRMWLRLRARGLAIHPMTQLLEETPDVAAVGRALQISGTPQFLLRIGYVSDYPEPVSPRMPVSRFVRRAS